MGSLVGKVIVITGASSGIGKALALEMAAPDVHLILAARNTEELSRVGTSCIGKGATCTPLFVDVSSPVSVNSFVATITKTFSTIDILINNAGISQRSTAEETSVEVDRKIMEVNFFGQISVTKGLWPLLINSSHANIVLVSSVVGTFGFSQRSAYSASKHALEGFFESWMIENKRLNIHFTTVSPGRIFTNISFSALRADGTSHKQLDNGQAKGITAAACAKKIVKAIHKDKRKIYVVQNEMILVLLRKYLPFLFFPLVKKLKSE